MYTFEWMAIVYGIAWLIIGVASPARRSARVIVGCVAFVATVVAVASFGSSALRLWLAQGYLAAGYWLPALAMPATTDGPREGSVRFETWLAETDRVIRPWLPALPPQAAVLTELAYLLCYPLVPLSFALVWIRGTVDDLDRFWVTVLAAGFACYASLPWLLSRPPRVLGLPAQTRGVPGFNVRVLDRFSHRWNTFPSGHVAVSCAAAWSVARVWPEAGFAIGIVAGAVAVGAAAGRYHYVVDVLLGFLIAALAAMLWW